MTAPLLALGAGISARPGRAAQRATPESLSPRFALLRLQDSDGSAADAELRDKSWGKPTGAALAQARITVHGFVPASSRAPEAVAVQAVFGENDALALHDTYRYFASATLANGKAVSFDAVRGAFCGFRIGLSQDGLLRVGELRMPQLRSGLHVLLLDSFAAPTRYRFTGDRERPLSGSFGLTPNYLAFSVVESV